MGLLTLTAAPAAGSPQTLKRSVENITQSPLDIVMSPFVAVRSIYRNMRDIDDSTAVRIVYPLPGFAWNTMVQVGAGTLRGVTGCMELIPGIILLPFETDLDPLFDPADEQTGWVNWDNPVYRVNFGIDYTTPE
jgi:hypothetical protein